MFLPILVICIVVKIDTSSGICSPRVFQNNKRLKKQLKTARKAAMKW